MSSSYTIHSHVDHLGRSRYAIHQDDRVDGKSYVHIRLYSSRAQAMAAIKSYERRDALRAAKVDAVLARVAEALS